MSSQSVQPSLVLTRRLADGTVEWVPLEIPQHVPAARGEAYALIDRTDYEAPQGLVAERQADDLIVLLSDAAVLVLDGFFATEGVTFHPTTDVAGGQGPFGSSPVTPATAALTESPDGQQIVWVADGAQMAAAADEHSGQQRVAQAGTTDDGSNSPLLWGGLALGALGLAAAAGGGGGGGSGGSGGSGSDGGGTNNPPPIQKTLAGNVVAGPVIEGHGLSARAFAANGTTLLGEARVGANGRFSIDIGDYTGVVIVRLVDADASDDYRDEASGVNKDLNAALSAMLDTGSASTVVINVNPLTTVAAMLVEREAGGTPTAQLVARGNAAIAALAGLSDLHAIAVTPLNDGYDAGDGLSEGERYGAMLAAFSGADLNNGGDSQQTLDNLLAGLSLSGSDVAELNAAAQALLLQGARTIETETGETISSIVAATVDRTAPDITSGATAEAVPENSGADQVVYTATATDAGTVTWSLDGAGDATSLRIDPGTGAVTLTDNPDFETHASYTFTVVATDDAGNSSSLAVSLEITDVGDETPPTLSSSNPSDNASAVAVGANIVLTFSENVQAGSGHITLSNGAGDSRTLDVTDTSQVTIRGDRVTINPAADLDPESNYHVRIDGGAFVDQAGNAFAGIHDNTTLNFATELGYDPTIVVFDLLQGVSSDHSGRSFQSGVRYDIYIRVDSDASSLSTGGAGPGTWASWAGTANLGSDDRVILVGNGAEVEGPVFVVNQMSVNATQVAWSSRFGLDAARLAGHSLIRATGFAQANVDRTALFATDLPGAFLNGQEGQLNTMYRTNMPAGVLTSQGLV